MPRSWSYLQRWFFFGIVIGVVSGFGAEAFLLMFRYVTDVFLVGILNYVPPAAGGEGVVAVPDLTNIKWWLIPLIVGFGGLISGIIVYSLAPEAEGHGTDSMIDSFHRKGGRIRGRVPIVKMVASSITIGTGGSAGREGPIAQIGAGFGSWMATRLKLSEHDRRTMVLCGAGAGIGAVFKAPLGASLFVIEVLYQRDIELEALVPTFVSSVISYSIYALINGFDPVFGAISYEFLSPLELVFFMMLGLASALVAILYTNIFYGIRDSLFRKISIPNMFKPAIGGVMVGLLAIELPQTLEMGYGWVQLAILGKLSIMTMLIIALAKIITTSLTISSGGSGGVFAPSLVIGGLVGGALGQIFQIIAPDIVTQPAAFILVGMAALFSGAAKVPISAMIMVAEMTRNYNFLIPAMVACGIAYVASGKWTLYEKQVSTRVDSPAHLGDYSIDLLEEIKVRDIMTRRLITVTPQTTVREVNDLMSQHLHLSYPVVDRGVLVGMVSYRELLKVSHSMGGKTTVSDIMSPIGQIMNPDNTAADALRVLSLTGQEQVPVVNPVKPGEIIGIVTHNDIIHGHESAKRGNSHKKMGGVLDRVIVEEVMRRDVVSVEADDKLDKLIDVIRKAGYHGYPVLDDGRLVGVITVRQIMDALKMKGDVTARDIMIGNPATAYPDEAMTEVIKRMYKSKAGRIPVVERDRPWRLVGLVTKTDILRALEMEEPINFDF